MNHKLAVFIILCLLALLAGSGRAAAQEDGAVPAADLGTALTYQGYLSADGEPAQGAYDLRFILYDALVGGSQVGGTLELASVPVVQGYFTVALDFGEGVFSGGALWLEVGVRPAGSGEAYTVLAPRQALTAAPYALYSRAAPWSGLVGMPPGFADGLDADTTYTAGEGLLLDGTAFSADTSYLQRLVSGTCAAGSSIRVINADGTVACQAVDNTAYTAGEGLLLDGTVFSADTSYLQRRVSGSCTANNSIRTINADGTVVCEFDNNTTYSAGDGLLLAGTVFSADFGGSGSAETVAHADHDHLGQVWSGVDNPLVITGTFGMPNHAPLVLENTAFVGDGLLVSSAGDDGLQVTSAGDDGLYVISAGSDGLQVDEASDDGVEVFSAGDDGLHVESAGGYGVLVGSAGETGVRVESATLDGMQVISADGTGVYVGTANANGVRVNSAGWHGVNVNAAGQDGLRVDAAGWDGLRVTSAGDAGVFVGTSTNTGVYANSAQATQEWGFYTPDKLYAINVNLASLSLVAQVSGPDPLAPGDLVAVVGLGDPLPDGSVPLPLVRLADEANFSGAIGVVESRMVFTAQPQPEGEEAAPALELHRADGLAQPGDYVALTVIGVAQVKIDPAAAASIQPGMRLTGSITPGTVRPLRTETLNGMLVSEGAQAIGIALAAPEPGAETIPVFVTLR